MPASIRWIVYACERLGVPMVALCCLMWFADKTATAQNTAMEHLTQALQNLQQRTAVEHQKFEDELKKIQSSLPTKDEYGKQAQSYPPR